MIKENKINLLFSTPELFVQEISSMLSSNLHTINLKSIVIDETHCLIPWDNNFRSSYLSIPS